MSDTLDSMRRKIDGAGELRSVVSTMKALAAASIGQYERAVHSLADYYRTIELGLTACLRDTDDFPVMDSAPSTDRSTTGAIVFGSDEGLVGQFNEVLAEFVAKTLRGLPGRLTLWAVGERMQSRLGDAGMVPAAMFAVPNSVHAITPLVGQILMEAEAQRPLERPVRILLFHNRPLSSATYEPVTQCLLPLDETWRSRLRNAPWPTTNLPEMMDSSRSTLLALVREYLFVSIFRACAESLASENASRLIAMQRAEKNIDELLEDLGRSFHRLRQSSIDEELFDVVSGFEAFGTEGFRAKCRITGK